MRWVSVNALRCWEIGLLQGPEFSKTKGVSFSAPEKKLGITGSPTREVYLETALEEKASV
jgi:hypothetical protein